MIAAHPYLNVAIQLVRKASRVLLSYSQDSKRIKSIKLLDGTLSTNLSQEVESLLVEDIERKFPACKIISDGRVIRNSRSADAWVLNPLDSSNSPTIYPGNCIKVGFQENGVMIISVVYQPEFDRIFTAVKGCGAYFNKKRLRVNRSILPKSKIAVGCAGSIRDILLQSKYDDLSNIRCSGSLALDICYTASNFLHLTLFYGELKIFQAAPLLILEEAGAVWEKIGDSTYAAGHPQILNLIKFS